MQYVKIKDSIVEQIEAGMLSPRQKLPAERKLAESFDTTRVTLREALSLLGKPKDEFIVKIAEAGLFHLSHYATTLLKHLIFRTWRKRKIACQNGADCGKGHFS